MKPDCFLVTNGIHLQVDGEIRICCLSNNKLLPSHFIPSTREQGLTPGWFQKNCLRCLHLEEKGIFSMRQHINRLFSKSDSFEYIDIRLSNQCNMACAMCSSDLSSLWGQLEGRKMINPPAISAVDPLLDKIDGTKNVFLHLAGGEPLIIRDHFVIFDKIKNKLPADKEFHLQITTNLSVVSQKVLDMLEKSDFVRICASIDATDSAYEYIRYPGKFSIIEKNLKKLFERESIEIVIQPTISLLNIFNLEDLINFFLELKSKTSNPLFLVPHPLFDPEPLSLFSLPLSLKERVHSFLQTLIKKTESHKDLAYTHNLLLGIINSSSREQNSIIDIKNFLSKIDGQRGSVLSKQNSILFWELNNL